MLESGRTRCDFILSSMFSLLDLFPDDIAGVPSADNDAPGSFETTQPKLDDIRIEYHPSSHRLTETIHFDEFGHQEELRSRPLPFKKPWKPFRSREDFEFAEITLDAAMNREQIDAMINLFHRCIQSQGSFSLNNHNDLCDMWEKSSVLLTPVRAYVWGHVSFWQAHTGLQFRMETITVPYKKEDRSFDVWTRPLWDWALDQLENPSLIEHFIWDAQRLSKFDGTSFVHFFHEPW